MHNTWSDSEVWDLVEALFDLFEYGHLPAARPAVAAFSDARKYFMEAFDGDPQGYGEAARDRLKVAVPVFRAAIEAARHAVDAEPQ
jgi:hypothetical protein